LKRSRLLSGGGEALIRSLTRSNLGTFAAPCECALGTLSLFGLRRWRPKAVAHACGDTYCVAV